MLYNAYVGFRMKSRVPGGIIGERLTQLNSFIVLFALGYLAAGLLTWGRPADSLLLIMGLILLLGAVFVWLVLRLVEAVLAAVEA
ncbi:MAG: hypothetical protein NZL94_09760 [Meiothermus sp.]|nr:hypothetical protein [Meiothermus sp.]MCS7059150.1 hypothetical protein [Meiothermus sp.]MDW8481092.1 hypothetical protein [Meiothermus sp.]